MNVLHIQKNPCIRMLKIARATKSISPQVRLFLLYEKDSPQFSLNKTFEQEFHATQITTQGIKDIVAMNNIDICHIHNTPNDISVMCKEAGVPYVFDYHDLTGDQLEAHAWKNADECIVVCERMEKILAARYDKRRKPPIVYSYPLFNELPNIIPFPYGKKPYNIAYPCSFYTEAYARGLCNELIKIGDNVNVNIYATYFQGIIQGFIQDRPNINLCTPVYGMEYYKALQNHHFGLLPTALDVSLAVHNKLFDYIASSLPIIVDSRLIDAVSFLDKHKYPSIIVDDFSNISGILNDLSLDEYWAMRDRALFMQKKFLMENQVPGILEIYQKVLRVE